MGYIVIGMIVAPILELMMGGVIEESLSWRANFYVHALCALGLILQVFFRLPETNIGRKKPIKALVRSYLALCCLALFWSYCIVMAFGIGGFLVFVNGITLVAAGEFGANEATTSILTGSITCGFPFGSCLSGRMSLSHSFDRMIFLDAGLEPMGVQSASRYCFWGIKT